LPADAVAGETTTNSFAVALQAPGDIGDRA
jgi:hypothetical protein